MAEVVEMEAEVVEMEAEMVEMEVEDGSYCNDRFSILVGQEKARGGSWCRLILDSGSHVR